MITAQENEKDKKMDDENKDSMIISNDNKPNEFVERINDGQMEYKKKLYWDKYKIISYGWSATCITSTDNNNNYIFIKINKICSKWNNEIHICSDKNWRKYQLFGYLDNGKLYSSYCKLHTKGLKKWNIINSIVGLILDKNTNPIIATFYVNNQEQIKVELPKDIDPNKIVLAVRVHPDGAIQSVPKFYQNT